MKGKGTLMKAVCADFSVGANTWGRLIAKILGKEPDIPRLSLRLTEVPEPPLPGPNWARVRTIMSGVSSLDEGIFLNGDSSALGSFLAFPFIPGNENIGIVTDVGPGVRSVEPGERVLLNPLLSCTARGILPLCPACSGGNPTACRNFANGIPGPGMIIGGCRETGGGWGDFFVAHESLLRVVPHHMDSDQAVLIPEFCRAVRAVLQHPPSPGDRIVIVGARSLGLLTALALNWLGFDPSSILMIARYPVEAEAARNLQLPRVKVIFFTDPVETADFVAEFLKAKVYQTGMGLPWIEGGADLVYETTGTGANVDFALRLTGEEKKLVLMGLNRSCGSDLSPLWLKGVNIRGTGFSGPDSYKGEIKETIDIALDLASTHGLPARDLITHHFKLEDFGAMRAVLQNRSDERALKLVFKNVI